MQYYIGIKGVQSGPFTDIVIRQKRAAGELPDDTVCWTDGWPEWRPVSLVFPVSGSTPPPVPATLPPAFGAGLPAGHAGRTSGLAITSLILGVAGLVLFIPALPAVIFGHIACSNIKRSQGTQTGRGMAIAGLIMGYMIIAIMPVGMLAAMAIPAFTKVRDTSREKTIISNLRQLDSAADHYMLENGVKQAAYADLVGPGLYLQTLNPVHGEDYSSLVIRETDREITVVTKDGRPITWQRHYTSTLPAFSDHNAR